MLESIQAMSLLAIMEIVGPLLLAVALIYGTIQWSRRRTGRAEAARERATRRLYQEAAKEEEVEANLAPADAPTDVHVSTRHRRRDQEVVAPAPLARK
jgi:hypothetical protein